VLGVYTPQARLFLVIIILMHLLAFNISISS
jgi:hypothetical protein